MTYLVSKFDTYYASFRVAVLKPAPASDNEDRIHKGDIYVGSRFQQKLIINDGFYKKLGFLKLSEIRAAGANSGGIPTVLKLKSSDDAQQLNVFRRYSVSLVPKIAEKTIPELGNKYNTSFPASCAMPETEIRDVIYSKEFTYGEGPNAVTYVVEEGSMMRVHTKASAAHIAKVNEVPSANEIVFEEDGASL